MARVLIIGAGIGGLATAVSLSKAGHETTVIELQPGLHASVYGVGIIQAANQLRALDMIGCAERCIAEGFGATIQSRNYDIEGNLLRTVEGSRVPGYDFPVMNGITRPRLHQILTDAALAAGATIEYGKTFTSISETAEGLDVAISDGTVRTADILIGADGVHSKVRDHVYDGAVQPQYSGKSVIRVNFPRLPEIDAITSQRGTVDGTQIGAGFVPLADDLAYMYVNIPWDRSVRLDQDAVRELMRATLAPFGGPAAIVRDNHLDGDEPVVMRPEEWVLAPAPWHKGRVVLIGDAVHSVTPNTAQGAAQAIEDGIVLTECLARHERIDDAFGAYVERRHDRCRQVVEYGVNARRNDFTPIPGFDQVEEGIKMRASLMEPI